MHIVLAWAGHVDGQNIWRTDGDGSNPKQLTHNIFARAPICSLDGKWVYFQTASAPNSIQRVPIEGGTSEIISSSVVSNSFNYPGFSLSHDGKLLAFSLTRSETRKSQIVVVTLDEKAQQSTSRFLDADSRLSGHPEFTPDGKSVVYSIRENGVENLWQQSIDGTRGHPITNFQTDIFSRYLYSPDGKTLGVMRFHNEADVVLLRDTTPN